MKLEILNLYRSCRMEVKTQLANFFLLHLNPYEVYHGHFFLKKELNLMLFNQCLITSAFKGGLCVKIY